MDLSFGEQIKVLLSREHKTIKELAENTEQITGIPTSRQNLTQKLKRDNFQEQDMRTLAAVLGYKVSISLEPASEQELHSILRQSQSDKNTDPYIENISPEDEFKVFDLERSLTGASLYKDYDL